MGFKRKGQGVAVDTNGTYLQGCVQAKFKQLCEVFGEPDESFDNYKSDAEWSMCFDDGTVATIYNYKNGHNYLGKAGADTEDMTEWHIGGRTEQALQLVRETLAV